MAIPGVRIEVSGFSMLQQKLVEEAVERKTETEVTVEVETGETETKEVVDEDKKAA